MKNKVIGIALIFTGVSLIALKITNNKLDSILLDGMPVSFSLGYSCFLARANENLKRGFLPMRKPLFFFLFSFLLHLHHYLILNIKCNGNLVTLFNLAGHNFRGQFIQNQGLNGSLERSGTKSLVKALVS